MKPSTHCRRMIQFSNFLLASMLAFAIPAAAQNPSDQAGDSTSTVKDFIRAADGLLAIQVALGQANGADADSRLEAAVQGFVARGAPADELVAMRSELQVAAGGFSRPRSRHRRRYVVPRPAPDRGLPCARPATAGNGALEVHRGARAR